MMEYGGFSLLEFVDKAHKLYISKGHLSPAKWHKTVKVIFNQMVEAIEYIHSKNVCHFDI